MLSPQLAPSRNLGVDGSVPSKGMHTFLTLLFSLCNLRYKPKSACKDSEASASKKTGKGGCQTIAAKVQARKENRGQEGSRANRSVLGRQEKHSHCETSGWHRPKCLVILLPPPAFISYAFDRKRPTRSPAMSGKASALPRTFGRSWL